MLKLVSLYFQPSLNLFEWGIYFNWHSSAISVTSSISFQLTILAPTNTTRFLGAIINKTYALNIIVPASTHILLPYSSSLPHERSTIFILHQFRNHPRKLSGLFKFAYCHSLYCGSFFCRISWPTWKVKNSMSLVIDLSVRLHHHYYYCS